MHGHVIFFQAKAMVPIFRGTPRQQARNKRKHATVFFNGNAVKLVDVAEKSGKDYFLLYDRVFRQGWSVEDAITKPIDVTKRNNHG